MLFVFDEAVGVDVVFWETTSTMWKPEPGYAWLAIFNPTKTSSQAFIEDNLPLRDGRPQWHRFTLDCLNHPNIKGRGRDDKPMYPAAVTWSQLDAWVHKWCRPIPTEEAVPADLEWPFGSGQWWKQGPSFYARCRGLWPSGGAWTVWCELDWNAAVQSAAQPPAEDILPEIGVDCASGGEDATSIHVRWGMNSEEHESSNAWGAPDITNRIKMLCDKWARRATACSPATRQPVSPKHIKVKIDDDGFGRAISQFLIAEGYTIIQVGAGSKSLSGYYPNKRSELWFQNSDRAADGFICVSKLSSEVQERLRVQLLQVEYELNSAGMRVVEPKDVTRERLGRSPDDADAFNLAFLEGFDFQAPSCVESQHRGTDPWSGPQGSSNRKIFGA
jgi:hypothetical protein